MNSQASSTTAIALPGRSDAKCTHFTAQGRRCRLRALRSGLCFRHAALQAEPTEIIFDMPGPDRDKPDQTAPQAAAL
jgi:hypothetical protein